LGFPIVPCYAVPCHSMQGVTLDKAVIYIGAKNFEKGQVYTALSRVCSINLILLSDIDIPYMMDCKKKTPSNSNVSEEYERLGNEGWICFGFLIVRFKFVFLILILSWLW